MTRGKSYFPRFLADGSPADGSPDTQYLMNSQHWRQNGGPITNNHNDNNKQFMSNSEDKNSITINIILNNCISHYYYDMNHHYAIISMGVIKKEKELINAMF